MNADPEAVWTPADSQALYRVDAWGAGYFGIDAEGYACVHPRGTARTGSIRLAEAAAALQAEGLRLPVLLRFTDILGDRVRALCAAFDAARDAAGYAGEYQPVYPVKVNQQRTVLEHILAAGHDRIGLEAGSKPELMAVLGSAPPGCTIVCNGYKDRAFIRLALTGQALGHRVYLVVEKPAELELILSLAAEVGVTPNIGLRLRLASVAAGHWQNTGGDKAKFGLTAPQALAAVERLRAVGRLDALRMLHVHVGSQVADAGALQRALAETAALYRDLRAFGAAVDCVDVGGGLAVDYEGRRAASFCSMNYDLADYARLVVDALARVCAEHGLAQPAIVSESGRALTAHHAVLLTEVVDAETADEAPAAAPPPDPAAAHAASRERLDAAHAAFVRGELDLAGRAAAERDAQAEARALAVALRADDPAQAPLLTALRGQLADKYFCNFSVFQSVPDVWGLDQVFPVMPLARLHEHPDRRVRLCDLTCDSDGRMDRYVDDDGLDSSLPLHALRAGERYYLAIFLVGAYQENLGDMHNLFGDTDAVNVSLTQDGWRLSDLEHGDNADELLRYVHFDPDTLRAAYRRKIAAAGLEQDAGARALALLEDGLAGYTYLLDD